MKEAYINTIERLAKSQNLHKGNSESYIKEILKASSNSLCCERTNVWIFNDEQTVLKSLLSYNSKEDKFSKENSLYQEQLPNYFSYLTKNEIIVSNFSEKEKMNEELLVTYIIPKGITSMIDVPLRSEGKMIGLICFEHINNQVNWSESERKFTQSLAQLLSLSIETNEKKKYRDELEKLVAQKEVLLHEINHRVKNNLSVVISLLNFQKSKVKDQFHTALLDELKDKVYSLAFVQNQLNKSDNHNEIEFSTYLNELSNHLANSYDYGEDVNLIVQLDEIKIPIYKAIPLGLIANEILTNSFKYAFNAPNLEKKISIHLEKRAQNLKITFLDNGLGFDIDKTDKGMGVQIVRDLVDQIDGQVDFETNDGVIITISCNLD